MDREVLVEQSAGVVSTLNRPPCHALLTVLFLCTAPPTRASCFPLKWQRQLILNTCHMSWFRTPELFGIMSKSLKNLEKYFEGKKQPVSWWNDNISHTIINVSINPHQPPCSTPVKSNADSFLTLHLSMFPHLRLFNHFLAMSKIIISLFKWIGSSEMQKVADAADIAAIFFNWC